MISVAASSSLYRSNPVRPQLVARQEPVPDRPDALPVERLVEDGNGGAGRHAGLRLAGAIGRFHAEEPGQPGDLEVPEDLLARPSHVELGAGPGGQPAQKDQQRDPGRVQRRDLGQVDIDPGAVLGLDGPLRLRQHLVVPDHDDRSGQHDTHRAAPNDVDPRRTVHAGCLLPALL
nr:hypothetical protein [Actinoplanes atraurantiacus]